MERGFVLISAFEIIAELCPTVPDKGLLDFCGKTPYIHGIIREFSPIIRLDGILDIV